MIEQQRVYRIKDLDSLLGFLREDLCWELPEASIDDVSFEWTGLDLNLSEDINKKLKGGLIRQLQPFATNQPWGIFVVEFATREVSIITLRQILRCFVAKRRGARPDLPAWQCANLLFICLYGENGFTFAHFKGDKPYSSRLTTFSWHPGEPVRTVCEFNLPALAYDYTWTPETWGEEWQKAFDVEKVNKDFYRQIARFFYRLTGKEGNPRELVLPYVGDDSGSISIYEEFAVRLIGRSIFCWFLKHKVSEESNVPLVPPEALSLAAARETEDFYHSILEPLFFEVMNKPLKDRKSLPIPRSEIIPFLNGGLFEPHPNDFYPGVANYGLKIPAAWFIDFFSLLERYNFTITENSSIDVDVAVDPEMLGRVFENLLAEVMPETGETARKATGSYYTPRVIVDYMVEQSLKQYLLTKTEFGEERVNRLLDYGESVEDFLPDEKLAVVTAFREIKVIDPACGSGAFPMGVLHRMLAVLEKVDPQLELWQTQYLKTLDGIVRQTVEKNIRHENWVYIRKLMIIRDSIYGVDIQPIAVEISKLRCFLSLVVDEIIQDDDDNRGVESLPNLEFKFVAANALIGLPQKTDLGMMENYELIEDLALLRKEYFTSSGNARDQVKEEFTKVQSKLRDHYEKFLITTKTDLTGTTKAIESTGNTQTRMLAEWLPFSYQSCGWFDPVWMFGDNDFDIIIANPPYLGEKGHKEIFRQSKQGTLKGYYQGKMDIFFFFFHLAINLGSPGAQIAFITTSYYPTASGANRLRRDFKKRTIIRELVNFNELRIFESAKGQNNMLTILSKGEDANSVVRTCITKHQGDATPQILQSILSWHDEQTDYYRVSQKELYDGEECYIRLTGSNGQGEDLLRIVLAKLQVQGKLLRPNFCDINNGIHTEADYLSQRKFEQRNDKNAIVGDGIYVLDRGNENDIYWINQIEKSPKEREYLKPFYKNSDVGKYWTNTNTQKRVIYINKREDDIDDLPQIKKHLSRFKKIIDASSDNSPYLHRPKNKSIFIQPKIVTPHRSHTNTFGYNEISWYAASDVFFITTRDEGVQLKYILALLNSKLYYVWLYHKGKRKGETLELITTPLSEIPIKKMSMAKQKPFIDIVNQILAITKDADYLANPTKQAQAKEYERQIDQMVYQLYGLTPDEIAVVEESR